MNYLHFHLLTVPEDELLTPLLPNLMSAYKSSIYQLFFLYPVYVCHFQFHLPQNPARREHYVIPHIGA